MKDNTETFLTSTFPDAANDQILDRGPVDADDLRRLAAAISSSRGSDQLAVDILVNFAAFPGATGRPAQEALRRLYQNPQSGAPERDEQIRAKLLLAARAICEYTLITAPQVHGGPISLPLSLLVASMGARCPVPAGGRDLAAAVQAHVGCRLGKAQRASAEPVVIDKRRRNQR